MLRSHVLTLPHPSPSKKPAWVGKLGRNKTLHSSQGAERWGICNTKPGWRAGGEKEMCRDIDDLLSQRVGSPQHPFRSTFCISRHRASLYVHVPACMRGRWDWGCVCLKSLAEKGISCGEKDVGGKKEGRPPRSPLSPFLLLCRSCQP